MYLADDVMAVTKAPLTCLIVDDSAFMRFHLRRMMDSFEGVIASEAANGNEAIREYGRLKPDIVLMDIVMPGMEGVETVKRICDTDPAARVIMISSVSYKEKVAEAMAAGAKWFIPKPVTTEELRRAIESVLAAPPAGSPACPNASPDVGSDVSLGVSPDVSLGVSQM